jgi:oxygen-dependent protoporphyrinogen oxidase
LRVAIVGGGIAGLAAAWELRNDAEITIFEPGPLGGKVRTTNFDGRPVDEGADAFVTRDPAALRLCEELGLIDELVAPAAGRTLLWIGDRLRPLPEGLVLGVPKRLAPIASSGLLSLRGMLRAAGDLVLPTTAIDGDVSVAELIGRRFGTEVAERLVEPLVGGIHAARISDLSAAAVVPQLLGAARGSRSLLRALRAQGAPGAPSAATPMFLSPRDGVSQLTDRLAEQLQVAGVSIRRSAVGSVRPQKPTHSTGSRPTGSRSTGSRPSGLEIDGEDFDGVVLATRATIAARLLASDAPPGLAELETTTVVLVTMSFSQSEVAAPEGVNGILVPPDAGRLMTALSFGSNKWPQWARPGRVVVRVSSGRHGDERAAAMHDEDLVASLVAELGTALGTPATPAAWRVSRWPDSFPLYRVGHLERVARWTSTLAAASPGVALAGSSYHGAGLPACIASGRQAAQRILASLKQTTAD